jgi:hypothetical protein
MKKSKRYGTIAKDYEDNPDRRIYCPEWGFYPNFIKELEKNAQKNNVSRSCFFETIVQNFFLLENPIIQIYKKNSYCSTEKIITLKKLTIHPSVLEMIAKNAKKSEVSQSRYLAFLFDIYKVIYKNEMILHKILSN